MLKFFREWLKDLNEAQKELNELGVFSAFNPWSGYYTYIVNKEYDRQETIRKDNKES